MKIKTLFLVLFLIIILGCSSVENPMKSKDDMKDIDRGNEAKVEENQISECDIEEDIIQKDICYYNLAIENLDTSICDKISRTQKEDSLVMGVKKDSCYIEISIEKPSEIQICEKIISIEDKNLCFKRVAIAKKELAICDKIDTELKWWCYSDVAGENKDPSICNKIEADNWKNICKMKFDK